MEQMPQNRIQSEASWTACPKMINPDMTSNAAAGVGNAVIHLPRWDLV